MSEQTKVDVLAVIADAEAQALVDGRPLHAMDHSAARAAVIELIEAAKVLAAGIEFRIDDPRATQLDRLRSSLARCGGAT